MEKHKENILKLREEGKSYKEIQKILGCSKSTISYHLGEGQIEKTNKRRIGAAEKFKKRIAELKEKNGCTDCKQKLPHYVLEFDHLPEQKKLGGIYKVFKTYGLSIALKEIEKCEVVCANCHKTRTYKRKPW